MGKVVAYSIAVFFSVYFPIDLPSAAAAPVAIMPLGDSITYGSSSRIKPGEEVSYRKALRDRLVAAGYEIVFVGSQNSGYRILPNSNHEGHRGWCASGCPENRSDILREVYNFLAGNPPDIVLLHIGTNDIIANRDPQAIVSAVSGILDNIFRYAGDQKKQIWVILALIINQLNPPCLHCAQTAAYNKALRQMAQDLIQKGNKILIVDMEKGAGIDYRLVPAGDMAGVVLPSERGYQKMADVWFDGLKQILTSSSPPLVPAPTSPAQPPEISATQPMPAPASTPEPAEGPKIAIEKEPRFASQAGQPSEIKGYAIQVNAFRDLNKAEEFVKTQKERGLQVYLSRAQDKDQWGWHRVYIGLFTDKSEAVRHMGEKKLKENFPNCFIRKLP